MARVLFATNYSMAEARTLVEAGTYPRHHLWGAYELERAGHEVLYLPWRNGPRNRFSRLLPARYPYGSILALLTAMRKCRQVDVVYAADPMTFELLARLRHRRRWPTPVVGCIHGHTAGWLHSALLGYDVVLTFSSVIRRQLVEVVGRRSETTLLAAWGPDLEWARYHATGEDLIVSTGKTLRDCRSLIAAVDGLGLEVRVHGVPADMSIRPEDVVAVTYTGYDSVLGDLARARLVVIPLSIVTGTFGITELNEAMALGKPVVMTRNPMLDVDVDAIGCGRTVPYGDPAALRRAISELVSDPDGARVMGARGRRFVEEHWNARKFGESLVEAVRMALTRHR